MLASSRKAMGTSAPAMLTQADLSQVLNPEAQNRWLHPQLCWAPPYPIPLCILRTRKEVVTSGGESQAERTKIERAGDKETKY